MEEKTQEEQIKELTEINSALLTFSNPVTFNNWLYNSINEISNKINLIEEKVNLMESEINKKNEIKESKPKQIMTKEAIGLTKEDIEEEIKEKKEESEELPELPEL